MKKLIVLIILALAFASCVSTSGLYRTQQPTHIKGYPRSYYAISN